jgi:large subunit ribosomal protein L27
MAHTKSQKATAGNRDSRSKRLGVKKTGGQLVHPGNIIVRQKGTKFKAGEGVKLSNDFTLIALRSGKVEFKQKHGVQYVHVWETK